MLTQLVGPASRATGVGLGDRARAAPAISGRGTRDFGPTRSIRATRDASATPRDLPLGDRPALVADAPGSPRDFIRRRTRELDRNRGTGPD
jgi:hypothetical protein